MGKTQMLHDLYKGCFLMRLKITVHSLSPITSIFLFIDIYSCIVLLFRIVQFDKVANIYNNNFFYLLKLQIRLYFKLNF